MPPERNRFPGFSLTVMILGIFCNASLAQSNQPEALGGLRQGSLRNGFNSHAYLSKNPDVLLVSPAEFQYSTKEVAEIVTFIASWAKAKGKSPILVGDMSSPTGGKLAQHKAHQNGLDVDIGYFPKIAGRHGHREKSFDNRFPESFVNDGKVTPNLDRKILLDLFLELLRKFPIQGILVDCALKKDFMLNPEAGFNNENYKFIMAHLAAKSGHDDHFHIRLNCPKKHHQCFDESEKFLKDYKCEL